MGDKYLFELGVEEIPHEMLTETIRQVKQNAINEIEKAGIRFGKIFVYGTPRRLAIYLPDLEEITELKTIEKKGPSIKAAYDSNGKPTKAFFGFLQANEAKPTDITKKEINGAEYMYLILKEGGKKTYAVLSDVIPKIIAQINFPKSMIWNNENFRFVRPIRWITSIYGTKHLPIEIGGVHSSNTTRGHRLLHDYHFPIISPESYKSLLKEKFVIVSHEDRKEMILDMVDKTAKRLKAKPVLSPALLDTLVSLTEYPENAVGTFDEEFLKLPKEVLISEMIEHQKYIPLEDTSGDLLNHFIIITNVNPNDSIIKGNERVLKARFKDGSFFYQEDRKRKLEEYLPRLKNMLFAKNLGSILDKVHRLEKITQFLSDFIGYEVCRDNAARAAELSKADLVTSMVGEFPELQGTIGYYYALSSMEPIHVAIAIREHYWPKFSGDALPSTKEGILLSLADRFDNLFCLYAQGNYVTGSKDPFALRRQTLGIIRILIEKKINLNISELFKKFSVLVKPYLTISHEEYQKECFNFITTRVKTVFKEYEMRQDEIEAGILDDVQDIYDSFIRIQAIHEARKSDNFINLAVSFKRIKNIVKGQKIVEFEATELVEEAEINLYKKYQDTEKDYNKAMKEKDYLLCVSILTSYREVVDQFFDQVMVMATDKNLQKNRLALLSLVDTMFLKLLDFEKIGTE